MNAMINNIYFLRSAAFICLFSIFALTIIGSACAQQLVDSVDPFIGTSGGGNTFPGPSAPFGMVQFSPAPLRGVVQVDRP